MTSETSNVPDSTSNEFETCSEEDDSNKDDENDGNPQPGQIHIPLLDIIRVYIQLDSIVNPLLALVAANRRISLF